MMKMVKLMLPRAIRRIKFGSVQWGTIWANGHVAVCDALSQQAKKMHLFIQKNKENKFKTKLSQLKQPSQ